MSERLCVWLDSNHVGTLTRKGRTALSFAYDAGWMCSGFPLSLSLPFQEHPFDDSRSRAFFDNLLPEQAVRDKVSKRLHVSQKNVFGLLAALGGECAGALTILHEGEIPAARPVYEEISRDRLGEIISLLPQRPLLAGEEGLRLSLAGAQTKLPIARLGSTYLLPTQGAPSTHILKPPIDDLPGSVENEAFCMALAKLVDLDAPKAEITETYPRGYLVERYDRVVHPDGIRRIHQEDFCQAMGLPAELKYQNEGGPGTRECFDLLEHSATPVGDRTQLFRLVVFNHLIGNTDAHAKNLSLLYDAPPRPRLAPFYDLLCVGMFEAQGLGQKNAMKIGGQYDPKFIMKRHWLRLADEAGLGHPDALTMITALAKTLSTGAGYVAEAFRERYGKSRAVPRIVEFIQERCRLTLERLAQ
ncbi:type II toxin-antitoxin system HipA family toxin [Pseudodesulfovibrio pelocollis]|uniref:type II toxin-antitoxin system HipA family toxin n=1 Tax=Pseudodesulfovibrio pelocollis TaxID=3051432 RepID=UPI00255B29DB|nr:type II toxin-antitoxin system HipA family toxin [Pseudodesulfovibrio sp. SB368]